MLMPRNMRKLNDVLADLPRSCARMYRLLIHSMPSRSTLIQCMALLQGQSYLTYAMEQGGIHVCLDKYIKNSIKNSERQLRRTVHSTITGSDQTMRQRRHTLLNNCMFNNLKFFIREWGKDQYWNMLNRKTLHALDGGEYFQYTTDELKRTPPQLTFRLTMSR